MLAPTLFWHLLFSYAFRESVDGIVLHTKSDGSLYDLANDWCNSTHMLVLTLS